MAPRYETRYFLGVDGHPETEVEVTKAEFVRAERNAGFHNTMGRPDEPATGGFGNGSIRGRVELVFPDRKETTTP